MNLVTNRYLQRIDSGTYIYNIRLFKGDLYNVVKMAELFNQKPYAINLFPVGGKPKKMNIKISGDVIVTSIQEEGNNFLIRLFNPLNEDKEVTLFFKGKEQHAKICKYKIETIKLDK